MEAIIALLTMNTQITLMCNEFKALKKEESILPEEEEIEPPIKEPVKP
jgi:hypothetical protein